MENSAASETHFNIQLLYHQGRRGVHSPHSLMLPAVTQSLHQTYTLFRGHKGGMVGMGCQDEMVEMDSQGEKERGETLVCRDHLVHKVGKFSISIRESP